MRKTPILLALLLATGTALAAVRPPERSNVTRPLSHAELGEALKAADAARDFITVTEAGRSVEGRPLWLVRLDRSGGKATWRVFLYAQQHGNEVAGKDALAVMVRDIAARPELLPKDAALWVLPQVNPDGAEADKRRNASDADLNRDHIALQQPEIAALYRVVREVMPHVAVDVHEFTRDSKDWTERGFLEWPIVMMDGANAPLFDAAVTRAGIRWVESARAPMAKAGHNYTRYMVGGVAPDEELRYSDFAADDGRNGAGAYGGLSFIIEAGIQRSAADPHADLAARVDAVLALLWRFIHDDSNRAADIRTVEAARRAPLPAFLATNVFWGNLGGKTLVVKAIDKATGRVVDIPTANMMTDPVVKRSVTTPRAYLIDRAATAEFAALLDRHGLRYESLADPRAITAERCVLVRVEQEFDELYQRYEGRQIVTRDAAAAREFEAGSLLVRLDGLDGRRAAGLLEPLSMFGLFQYPQFRALVATDGTLPVWRVTADPGPAPGE
jgi:hypothetical protein